MSRRAAQPASSAGRSAKPTGPGRACREPAAAAGAIGQDPSASTKPKNWRRAAHDRSRMRGCCALAALLLTACGPQPAQAQVPPPPAPALCKATTMPHASDPCAATGSGGSCALTCSAGYHSLGSSPTCTCSGTPPSVCSWDTCAAPGCGCGACDSAVSVPHSSTVSCAGSR